MPAALTMLTTCAVWSSLYLERPEGELLKPLPTRSLRGSFERPGREAPEEGLMALVGAD